MTSHITTNVSAVYHYSVIGGYNHTEMGAEQVPSCSDGVAFIHLGRSTYLLIAIYRKSKFADIKDTTEPTNLSYHLSFLQCPNRQER